jgi:hypothetical protein
MPASVREPMEASVGPHYAPAPSSALQCLLYLAHSLGPVLGMDQFFPGGLSPGKLPGAKPGASVRASCVPPL